MAPSTRALWASRVSDKPAIIAHDTCMLQGQPAAAHGRHTPRVLWHTMHSWGEERQHDHVSHEFGDAAGCWWRPYLAPGSSNRFRHPRDDSAKAVVVDDLHIRQPNGALHVHQSCAFCGLLHAHKLGNRGVVAYAAVRGAQVAAASSLWRVAAHTPVAQPLALGDTPHAIAALVKANVAALANDDQVAMLRVLTVAHGAGRVHVLLPLLLSLDTLLVASLL